MESKLEQESTNNTTNNIWADKFLRIHTENKKLSGTETTGKRTTFKEECYHADMRNKQVFNTDDFDF